MEQLKHECGVALVRLLKPPAYYRDKYGSRHYGLDKLYLMMEKQHNRGQEGAGVACVSLDAPVGTEYMHRERAEGKDAITEIFKRIHSADETHGSLTSGKNESSNEDSCWETASLFMGHLRYSTTGHSGLNFVHPFLRRNNWRAKNLCLCGNFNMTNMDEVFQLLTSQGQSPRVCGDGYLALELMGHRLDREVERLFEEAKSLGLEHTDITHYIDSHVDMRNVLYTTMQHFDGGYVMCGLTGSGEMFAIRDPWAIRPAYYVVNDEVVAVSSERPVLQTTFGLECDDIHELPAGKALITRRNGACSIEKILEQKGDYSCSFERIYFSRGSDRDIYRERKMLGEQLMQPIHEAIGGETSDTVFSFIPNTAEVAFYGMLDGFKRHLNDKKIEALAKMQHLPDIKKLEEILHTYVRSEKVAWKDIKLRTFIAEGHTRNDLASHVYDITYGSLRPGKDNLVIIDDSIVRGTTLKHSILKILDKLHPKKIVIVSSSPQVRYPDYYGIDMPRLEEFCAFRAAIELLKERGLEAVIETTYRKCKAELEKQSEEIENCVRDIYKPFSVAEINRKMVEMLRPEGMETPVELVFQSIEGLHKACPHHHGDWYFTGHYPTLGGRRLVNKAFVSYYEQVYE